MKAIPLDKLSDPIGKNRFRVTIKNKVGPYTNLGNMVQAVIHPTIKSKQYSGGPTNNLLGSEELQLILRDVEKTTLTSSLNELLDLDVPSAQLVVIVEDLDREGIVLRTFTYSAHRFLTVNYGNRDTESTSSNQIILSIDFQKVRVI